MYLTCTDFFLPVLECDKLHKHTLLVSHRRASKLSSPSCVLHCPCRVQSCHLRFSMPCVRTVAGPCFQGAAFAPLWPMHQSAAPPLGGVTALALALELQLALELEEGQERASLASMLPTIVMLSKQQSCTSPIKLLATSWCVCGCDHWSCTPVGRVSLCVWLCGRSQIIKCQCGHLSTVPLGSRQPRYPKATSKRTPSTASSSSTTTPATGVLLRKHAALLVDS